ncbi:MAG: ATP-binding protein [Candidatus Thorarchaeota archaeon]|nr:MAG: ATP-binding protein [Candidatus Thorarchaeota archaeon]
MDDRDTRENPDDELPPFEEEWQYDMPIELIPKTVLDYRPRVSDPPDLHIDLSVGVVLGRSDSFHQDYRGSGLGMIGAITESSDDSLTSLLGMPVSLDLVSPHVMFVSGKRGSGKSYTLGIIAEELARTMERREIEVAAVVIDTVDVFRQSVDPNLDQAEMIQKWGMEARGFPVNVYIPRLTYISLPDEVKKKSRLFPLSISPSELSASDWGFILEKGGQLSTTMENLIGDVLDGLRRGYTLVDGEKTAPNRDFSIQAMIKCIELSPPIGELYKLSTRTAMIQRLRRADRLGIFRPGGTSAQDLAVAGQIAVIDVAPLGSDAEAVLAILTNMLCRQVLTYRMAWTEEGTSAREELPPTWLIVDEAHTLVPRTGSTPAKSAIVGYAKLGRRFGCSLVLCTQQPSAVSDDAISQADIIISHALSHDNDIKALQQRAPAVMPDQFRDKVFISSLPRGVAIAFDQSTENKRGFLVQIRPRLSQHGGTDRLSSLFEAAQIVPMSPDDEVVEEAPLEGEAFNEEVDELPAVPQPPIKLSKEGWDQLEERMKSYVEDLFEREQQEFAVTDEPSPVPTEAGSPDVRPLESIGREATIAIGDESVPDIDLKVKQFGPLPLSVLEKAMVRQVFYSKRPREFLFGKHGKSRDALFYRKEEVLPEKLAAAVLNKLLSYGLALDEVHHDYGFTFVLLSNEEVRAALTVCESDSIACVPLAIVGGDRKTVTRLVSAMKS